ncbi:hypothetical protein KUV50_11720 [Membranicola marinus]|uniref:Uncharacterized protein n=1 Tax=Membranihabitans marinus TaxID=1227546 RepID=A0A953HQ56_9BACT|nr:hypothetical protein [Membranihabitans marinus]MBY5958808.1 hypothetical protein [Membranihabitans marinus]
MKNSLHTFHIPVMGIGFTVDTPLKVAPFGIDSVIAIGDDGLLEKMRKMYSEKFSLDYRPISKNSPDARANRITAYLNMVQTLVTNKWREMQSNTHKLITNVAEIIEMLPDNHSLVSEFQKLRTNLPRNTSELKRLFNRITLGRIDVNIMTKLDKENYVNGVELPREFNDAHAALRGYAQSDLTSAIIFSAGMNPRLYSYLEEFEDFYPDSEGGMKKEIILKVSDFRSAYIQGLFMAKKGLWVSEFRVESGLNCGGHAFATAGHLMGPILEEFKEKRRDLIQTIHEKYVEALGKKSRSVPNQIPELRITVQGGVGTPEEHQFLIDRYQLDSVGWGTPFLLVPEVTNVDQETRDKLKEAREKDLYLSNISPLGVPFHSLRNNSKDEEKLMNIRKGRPGSACPKELLSLNKEFTDKPICTASRQYQRLKLLELERKQLSPEKRKKEEERITEKSCICVGLGTAALKVNGIDTRREGPGVSICPGPNMAYFSEEVNLQTMVDHIYGRGGLTVRADRPHMFIKELSLYLAYFENELKEIEGSLSTKQEKYFNKFAQNLKQGIAYYKNICTECTDHFKDDHDFIKTLDKSMDQLEENLRRLHTICI